MKTRSFPWALIAAAAVAGAGFAGVATYVKANSGKPVGVQAPEDPGVVIQKPTDGKTQPSTNDANANNSVTDQKPTKTEALNKILKEKNYSEFRVLNVSLEDNGNAIIDFNKELLGGMGSGAESEFIDILKTTLAQYPDVKTFQIRIEGQIQKSLSHFEMIDPVPVR